MTGTVDPRTAVEARIAQALLPRGEPALAPPTPYVRRHLVEHAAAGNRLAELTTATLLPYVDAGRLRALLRQNPSATGRLLDVWHRAAHAWDFADPAANADTLRFWAVADDIPESAPADGCRLWATNWANIELGRAGIIGRRTGPILALSAPGRVGAHEVILSGGADHTVRVWDTISGGPVGPPLPGHMDRVTGVGLAGGRAGRTLAVSASHDGTIRCHDLDDRSGNGRTVQMASRIETLTVADVPGLGEVVITGAWDGIVRFHDPVTLVEAGAPLSTGHHVVAALDVLNQGDGAVLLVTAGADHALRVWDLPSHHLRHGPLVGHRDWVTCVACTVVDGRRIAISGSSDHTGRLWDLDDGAMINGELAGHTKPIHGVAAVHLPDGRALGFTAGGDGLVQAWGLRTGTNIGDALTDHTNTVEALTVLPLDGAPVIVTASWDETIREWNVDDLDARWETTRTCHDDRVSDLATATLPNGQAVVVSGSWDGTLQVWNLDTGNPVSDYFMAEHDGAVLAVATCEVDGRLVAISGGDDGDLRSWDASTGSELTPFELDAGTINSVTTASLPDGAVVAIIGTYDGAVHIYDVPGRRRLRRFSSGSSREVGGLVTLARPIGEPPLVLCAVDDRIRGWDLVSVEMSDLALGGHDGNISALTQLTLRDGRTIVVSGGTDRTVRAWDLMSRLPIGDPLEVHQDWVTALAVGEATNGDVVVVSGSADHTVRLSRLRASLEAVGHPLTTNDEVSALALSKSNGLSLILGGGGLARVSLTLPLTRHDVEPRIRTNA